MDYRHGSHTACNIEYHFVWATKYRKNILRGDVAARTRELVRQTCDAFEIKILEGVVSGDHVHILVSAPPTMAPSEIMRRIKGRSSSKLMEEFPGLQREFWGRRNCSARKSGELDNKLHDIHRRLTQPNPSFPKFYLSIL